MSAPLDRSLPRRIWKTTRHDIGRKLTALVMASALWLVLQSLVIGRQPLELQVRAVATQAEADQQRLTTPGVYLIVPDELIVRSMSDPRVHLTISGLRDEVVGLNMSAKLVFTVADLGGEDEITLSRPLERDSFSVPGQPMPKLTSFRVRPEVLQVTLARRDTAEITLTADNVVTAGKPKDHYFFRSSSIKLYPNTVDLTGPRTVIEPLLEDASRIKLEPVDLSGRSSTVSQPVGLSAELREKGVTLQSGRSQDQVLVTVPIEPEDIVRELYSVPIVYRNADALELRHPPQRASNFPKSMDVKVWGPPPELNGRTDDDLLANIVLVFDWSIVPPTFSGSATGSVKFASVGLPDTVRVTDAKGSRDLTIEYDLETLAAPGTAESK
ncbi:MAG TPA: YbbR-like domain-containing protein [Planctomycetota bacterium]|jgi:hypothetical protein|nr:YbbR-like domain-containing protein [Planctomycetota bacterium]